MPYGYCGANNATEADSGVPSLNICSNAVLSASFETDFNYLCSGFTECEFTATSYINNSAENKRDYPECVINPAKVYLQYICTQT